MPSAVLTSVSFSPSFSVAVGWPLSKEPPTTPISTDLPFFAIETSRKMFSFVGKVPVDRDALAEAVRRDQRLGRRRATGGGVVVAGAVPGDVGATGEPESSRASTSGLWHDVDGYPGSCDVVESGSSTSAWSL